MNKEPVIISVVTVSYNAVSEIEKTILSVIEQTYPTIEFIIIDGGSTDGTVDLLENYNHYITYWKSEPDKGIYDAMNKGICKANGEWVIFMNSGDWFYDKFVVEELFSENYSSAIGIIYGSVEFRFAQEKIIQNPYPLSYLLKGMAFSHQAAFIRTSLIKQSPYDTHYRIAADYEFFLRQYFAGVTFHRVSVTIASFDKLAGISASPSYINYKRHLNELILLEKLYHTKTHYKFLFFFLCFRFRIKNIILKIIPRDWWNVFLKKRINRNQ